MDTPRDDQRTAIADTAFDLLQQISKIYPGATVGFALSALLTASRGLIGVALDADNSEHNRAELLSVLTQMEKDIWERAPKSKMMN